MELLIDNWPLFHANATIFLNNEIYFYGNDLTAPLAPYKVIKVEKLRIIIAIGSIAKDNYREVTFTYNRYLRYIERINLAINPFIDLKTPVILGQNPNGINGSEGALFVNLSPRLTYSSYIPNRRIVVFP